jgi:hypothetical protein
MKCSFTWKDICAPINEGGLGIQNIQATNQSLILSAAWRIAQQPDSQLYNILRAKYFRNTFIWIAKPNVPKSAFWTAIIKVMPVLVKHSFYHITNGNIPVWSSPWWPKWQHIHDHLIIQEPGFNYPSVVCDLWIPNQKKWNEDLIYALFDQHMASNITNTHHHSIR